MTDETENAGGAYSLDALSDDERRRFEEHLMANPDARAETDEFRATAARLGAAEAQPPPADLKARVMAEVEATRQDTPVGAEVVPLRHRRLRVAARVAAAAAVVLIMASAAVVAFGAQNRADRADQLVAVLGDPEAQFIDLEAETDIGLRVAWSPSRNEAVLLGEGVPAPAIDSTYELWLLRGDIPEPAVIFRPDAAGGVEQLFATDLAGVDALGVTVEPAGGSPAPTGALLLVGDRDTA